MFKKCLFVLATCFFSFSILHSATAEPVATDVKEVRDHGEIDKIKCDVTASDTFHVGDTYNFFVDFSAKDASVRITDINYWFWADNDYNGADSMISLHPTAAIKNANWVVKNKEMRLAESTDYTIKTPPTTPSDENILFKAEIIFREILPDGSISPKEDRMVRCMRGKVTK